MSEIDLHMEHLNRTPKISATNIQAGRNTKIVERIGKTDKRLVVNITTCTCKHRCKYCI